jgi:hypothetical protein
MDWKTWQERDQIEEPSPPQKTSCYFVIKESKSSNYNSSQFFFSCELILIFDGMQQFSEKNVMKVTDCIKTTADWWRGLREERIMSSSLIVTTCVRWTPWQSFIVSSIATASPRNRFFVGAHEDTLRICWLSMKTTFLKNFAFVSMMFNNICMHNATMAVRCIMLILLQMRDLFWSVSLSCFWSLLAIHLKEQRLDIGKG